VTIEDDVNFKVIANMAKERMEKKKAKQQKEMKMDVGVVANVCCSDSDSEDEISTGIESRPLQMPVLMRRCSNVKPVKAVRMNQDVDMDSEDDEESKEATNESFFP
jgi:hypothetical protein